MNYILENKVRRIPVWLIGYLVIAAFAVIVILSDNHLKKICIDKFHKRIVIKEYAYRAILDKNNITVITDVCDVKNVLSTTKHWTFDENRGIIIIPAYGKYDTISIRLMKDPEFFRISIVPAIWNDNTLKLIYTSSLVKVDMKSFYQNNERMLIYDGEILRDEDILKEYNDILGIIFDYSLGLFILWSGIVFVRMFK